jgi:DNA-binding transcriptional LysR family regulator
MARQRFRYKHNRLLQLRGFCYVAQTKNMSKAAKLMGLTQPSVSLQIQALERELKATLFDRHGPKIELTHDGKTLYDLSASLIEGIESLDKKFSAQRDSIERGQLDIAAGSSTIQYLLPKYVEHFTQEHPLIDLRLHNVTGREGLVLLKEGKVDFCVGPLMDIPDEIEFHPMVTYDPVLITQKNHPLTKKKNVTLKEISKYPLVLPPRHLSTWRQVEMVFGQHNLRHEVKLEVGGWEVIKKYVELGMGISIVMSLCIEGDENLAVIPVKKYFPKRIYGIVHRKGKYLPPQAKGFIDDLLSAQP